MAVQATLSRAPPVINCAVTSVGAVGICARTGVTAAEITGAPRPTELSADTRNVYGVALVRLLTVAFGILDRPSGNVSHGAVSDARYSMR